MDAARNATGPSQQDTVLDRGTCRGKGHATEQLKNERVTGRYEEKREKIPCVISGKYITTNNISRYKKSLPEETRSKVPTGDENGDEMS